MSGEAGDTNRSATPARCIRCGDETAQPQNLPGTFAMQLVCADCVRSLNDVA